MVITKGQVVTYVADEVVKYFKDVTEVPSKLEIQRCISKVTSGVEVAMGTKRVKEVKEENGKKVITEYDKEITKPLIDYYVKISLSEIKAIQECILKNIAKVKYPKIESKGKISQALKELKKAAWMIKSDQVVSFVRELAEAIVYSEGEWKGEGRYEKAIYLKSEVERSGKSTLNAKLLEGAKKVGLRTAIGTYPCGRFGNLATFASNNFVVINDTSYESIRNINQDKIKSLLRREPVEHEMKGLDPVLVEPKSAIIAAGNIEPPQAGDQCWRIFDCIGLPVTELDESMREEAWHSDLTLLFNTFNSFNSFNQASEICKMFENKYFNKMKSSVKSVNEKLSRVPLLSFLLDSLDKVKGCAIDFERMTLKQFFDTLKVTGTDLSYSQMNALTKSFKMLYAFGYIAKENHATEEYTKWNVTKLFKINPEEVFVYSNETEDIYEEVQKTADIWDKLIAFFEDFENDPNNKFLKGDEDAKLDDSWTICNKFDKEGEYNPNGDQVCVNKPLDLNHISRKNEEVHKQNYLFECDEIPVKEQVDIVENAPQELKDSIFWVCYTGGKSIHTVIKTNTPDSASKELRRYIHRKLNEKYFGGNADPSGQNAGRLARAPNAIRQDDKHPGKKQTCLYFNHEEPVALDVSEIISDFEEEQRLQKSLKETVSGFENNNKRPKSDIQIQINTLNELKEWNKAKPSKAKEECISFLEGRLKDWNRGIACVRELRNFGFSDFDIESEGMYNDTWIKQAIKGAK